MAQAVGVHVTVEVVLVASDETALMLADLYITRAKYLDLVGGQTLSTENWIYTHDVAFPSPLQSVLILCSQPGYLAAEVSTCQIWNICFLNRSTGLFGT